jgi:RHS repeat-associated protein
VLDPRVSAKPFLYTYDTRASVVAQLAMPTGQTIAYARDAQGRLLSTTLSGTASQTLATHAYTYDLAGQRTTATTTSATTAYTYDALRQLATATETPAGTGQTPTREFAYAYDPIGNRLTAATATETTAYTANSVNQYTAIVPGTGLPFAPTYDANGNTTTLPSGLVLDYDEENRLVSAATLTTREEYTYDGLGRRVERRTFTAASGLTAPATTTRYVYDGWRVLAELTSTQSSPFTLQSSYTRGLDLSGTLEGAGGIGGLLAMTRDPAGSATSAYYFHDGNGNVSTLVSASDALLASYTYTPFGDTLTATGTWASVNAYRFSAKECDAFTGLYYYGLRYYNPSTGRWLSRDPIGEKGGVNLYGMVRNNPIYCFDRLGLESISYEISAGRFTAGELFFKGSIGAVISARIGGGSFVAGPSIRLDNSISYQQLPGIPKSVFGARGKCLTAILKCPNVKVSVAATNLTGPISFISAPKISNEEGNVTLEATTVTINKLSGGFDLVLDAPGIEAKFWDYPKPSLFGAAMQAKGMAIDGTNGLQSVVQTYVDKAVRDVIARSTLTSLQDGGSTLSLRVTIDTACSLELNQ